MATSQVVLGLGFGDEGKGKTVSYLCSKAPESLVVRFSGGQQAGHNVMLDVLESTQHVFSNFGSGTLQGCPTYWSEFCTFDPMGIVNEAKILATKGIEPTIIVNENAPVTTPYEKAYCLKRNSIVNHGTCGVGVGQTWEREERLHSIKVSDLSHPPILKVKMHILKTRIYPAIHIDDEVEEFLDFYCEEARKIINITDGIPPCHDNYIFEGAQGLMLDQKIGFFPHVTRSNTGLKNIRPIIDGTPIQEPGIFLVTRAYQTRHGTGHMSYEDWPIQRHVRHNPYEINKDDGHQGEFRRSVLDLDMINYALSAHKIDTSNATLVITCLDIIQNMFSHHYGINGKVFVLDESDFVNRVNDIVKAKYVWTSDSPYSLKMNTCIKKRGLV